MGCLGAWEYACLSTVWVFMMIDMGVVWGCWEDDDGNPLGLGGPTGFIRAEHQIAKGCGLWAMEFTSGCVCGGCYRFGWHLPRISVLFISVSFLF